MESPRTIKPKNLKKPERFALNAGRAILTNTLIKSPLDLAGEFVLPFMSLTMRYIQFICTSSHILRSVLWKQKRVSQLSIR
jgi:hypothetical protein